MSRLPDDRVITLNEARRKGLCVKGIAQWAKENGLDIRVLVRSGLTVGEIRRLNDGYGNLILERMENEQ